ncbi:MAG: plastocyanin/azurin family copper-binding protein [Nitrospirota bacterium]
MNGTRRTAAVLCMIALFFTGCSGARSAGPPVTVTPAAGESSLLIKASSFRFEPNTIIVQRGDTVLFLIENTSGSTHNFSLKDPSGTLLLNIDLPGRTTQRAKVTFTEAGDYEFYCDKPFHPAMGMKGRIEARQAGPGRLKM